ncbi:NAD(P)-binding protein [Pseudovirgaria hyperparasitica]|uniref:NAD(P)-binding protein n=1 Tax=Pseudovirgaria hyperparasitica TaxID=470096 RepID=A0A6A6W0A0_9PEZI|nr:NAD(P)-binding protein [Pseudovirgaria hyperparasitica]KAF2754491.1 NAD(P)-binding protein [Pseudovirgaria hyperparasitica]
MQAWQFTRTGPARAILSLQSIPVPPRPIDNEVLIRITHSSLNGGSNLLLTLIPMLFRSPPCTPGIEFSGVVESVGPSYSKTNLLPGTRVFGTLDKRAHVRGKGALAEWLLVKEGEVVMVAVPEGVELSQAAAMSASGSTAVSMCLRAGLKGGERVLVNGASGGVGSLLVQILRNLGVREIVAVCSGKNADFVKRLGADEVLDYNVAPVEQQLIDKFSARPFDVIMDTVGIQSIFTDSPHYLKNTGVFVNVGAMANGPWLGFWYWFLNSNLPLLLGGIPRKYIMFSNNIDEEQLGMLAHWAGEGKLVVPVDQTFELDRALDAYDLVESGRVRGKIVINV